MSLADRELLKVLDKLGKVPVKVQKSVSTGATRAAAVVLQKSAKTKIPLETGNLKEGVKVKKAKSKSKTDVTFRIGMDNSPYTFTDGKTSQKGTTTKSFYAFFLHEGTKHIAPVPFFIQAYTSDSNAALAAMRAYMKKRTEKELKKIK